MLAGVSAYNCIAQTGSDAFARSIRVTYAEDACCPEGPLRSVSGTASGRSQRLATLTDCPSAADSSTDSITSSTWKAS